MEINAVSVFLYALLTAVATGVGALPLLFVRNLSPRWIGLAGAAAAGLMGGASLGLIHEGVGRGALRTALGVAVGIGSIALSRRWFAGREVRWGDLSGTDARRVLMVVAIMTAHSFSEGVGVGVSFGGGEALGVFITAAIAVHNIPEGLAISLAMVPRGTPVWKAALWSIFSSLPQPLMAVPAFLLVEAFAPVLPVGLGFAAGAMGWMIFAELIPEALETAGRAAVAATAVLAAMAMLGFQAMI
ncbi:MAG TPA: ZIP family metal transporter [Longimicrobium sp.]|nr:ZIP family metal transporter [Longimicrobium sp.]